MRKSLGRSLERDSRTVRAALENLSFFTTLLPELGDYYDGLLWGSSVVTPPPSFKTKGELGDPVFLSPFWQHARLLRKRMATGHDPETTDYETIRAVRTALHGAKKLEIPPSPHQLRTVLDRFAENEGRLKDLYLGAKASLVLSFAREVLDEVIGSQSAAFLRDHLQVSAHHGPGAVAGAEKGIEKWLWKPLPFSQHGFASCFETVSLRGVEAPERPRFCGLKALPHQWRREMVRLGGRRVNVPSSLVPQGPHATGESMTRLLAVPKDSRGPRLIACEPKETMWLQQGLSSVLMRHLESHPLTSGQINFESQEVNRELARVSSRTHQFATLDLSDASDLVSNRCIEILFANRPGWLSVLQALRSTRTIYQGLSSPLLNKYSMMGSALCFPIESLFFWCIAVGVLRKTGVPTRLAAKAVFVYGDDIIVPAEHALGIAEALELVGLRVNERKSFWGRNRFRESCGMDAFNGVQVSPLRLRKVVPSSSADGTGVSAWVDYANQASLACMYHRAQTLRAIVERVVRKKLPVLREEQSFLHFVPSPSELPSIEGAQTRWDPRHQVMELRALMLVPSKGQPSPLFDGHRLLASLVMDLSKRDFRSATAVTAAASVRLCWAPLVGSPRM